MILYEKKEKCCGCTACASICPQKCIKMQKDSEGFLYPAISDEDCINCGLCKKVCPINGSSGDEEKEKSFPIAYGGWIDDEHIRYESSSGGIFTLLAEQIIRSRGIVYGAALKKNKKGKICVEHVRVDNINDLNRLRGSKYVQSDMNDIFRMVRDDVDKGIRVLFSGTPCQCAGVQKYLNKYFSNKPSAIDKLNTVDFVCHGVPSPKVFDQYLQSLERKRHSSVNDFKFRLKDKGWYSSGLQMGTEIKYESGEKERRFPAWHDCFMIGFLNDIFLRPACYACAFKKTENRRDNKIEVKPITSDITLADFWGCRSVDRKLDNHKGVSLVLLNTEKGKELFERARARFAGIEVPFDKAMIHNHSYDKCAVANRKRSSFFGDLEQQSFESVSIKYLNKYSWVAGQLTKRFKNLMRKIDTPFLQLFKFSLVGCTNTALSYLINISTLYLLHKVIGIFSLDYIVANITAFLISVFWSFNWNRKLVFTKNAEKTNYWKALMKTYVSYALTGIFINNFLSTLWIYKFEVSKYVAPLLNIPFAVFLNFYLQRRWVYGDKAEA